MLNIPMDKLEPAKLSYLSFIESTRTACFDYSLTYSSDSSAYARCFAVFGYHLVGYDLGEVADGLAHAMVRDLCMLRDRRQAQGVNLLRDKPYLQLLTFTLSALKILKRLDDYDLVDHVSPVMKIDLKRELSACGVFDGQARSGNHSMFLVIMLIYLGKRGFSTEERIADWEDVHIQNINKFGFWGLFSDMTYSQFQNGYHQYEILEYLATAGVPWQLAADHVASLVDKQGHFAPYPGGGGCYDYDALFLLTGNHASVLKYSSLLNRSATTILSEQNGDGGFCESNAIRPRSFTNLIRSIDHVSNNSSAGRLERLRFSLSLLRPKHNRIHTHWSDYSREWGESDLWDSWFRMLAIARIDCSLNPQHISSWGFIDFPGIGYHPLLRGIDTK